MKRLNEKGNTTIFIIGSFSMFLLFLLIIGSFSQVFILKEKASNNAEQASIVATGIVMDYLQIAIDAYDSTLLPEEYPFLSINLKVNAAKGQISATNRNLSSIEVRNRAINQVLKGNLPGNFILEGFVSSNLSAAESKISSNVRANIENNDGEVKGTRITFTGERIQVETSTRYKAFKYDDLLPEEKRYVRQTGKGPKLDFAHGLSGGWGVNIEL